MTRDSAHTPTLRAEIRRLAGTMPIADMARRLDCFPSTIRAIAAEEGISLKIPGGDGGDPRPGPDDKVVSRLDALRSRVIEVNGLLLSADVAAALTKEAVARGTSLKALSASVLSLIALDGLVGAVLDDR